MTDITTLREIIRDGQWLLDQDENLVERSIASSLLSRADFEVIEVATGVRRSGKSKLLLWVGRKLQKKERMYIISISRTTDFFRMKRICRIYPASST